MPSVSAARLNVNPRRSPRALRRGPPGSAGPPPPPPALWNPGQEHHVAARNAEVNTYGTANQSSGPGSKEASEKRKMTTGANTRVALRVFKGLQNKHTHSSTASFPGISQMDRLQDKCKRNK